MIESLSATSINQGRYDTEALKSELNCNLYRSLPDLVTALEAVGSGTSSQ